MNVIWQLSNDVNFINERKQNNFGNESSAIKFFKGVPPLSCSMIWMKTDNKQIRFECRICIFKLTKIVLFFSFESRSNSLCTKRILVQERAKNLSSHEDVQSLKIYRDILQK